MNRIERMVAEMCPDGVEFVPLGEAVHYSSARVSAGALDGTTFVGVDNLVANCGGRVDADYSPNTDYVSAFDVGDVLIGNIRPYLKKIWLADRSGGASGDVLVLSIVSDYRSRLDSGFLFVLLSSDDFFAFDQRRARGGKMPRGDKSAILKYRIPVPPIEIQREIVDILDSFTRLEAELEAELEARRQQFRLVADRFIELAAGEQARIADHLEFIRGVTYSKSDEVSAGYGRGVLRACNIDGLSRRIVFDDLRTVSSGVKFKDQQLLHLDDVLMVGSSGSLVHLGKSALVREDDLKSGPMLFGAFMMVLRVRDTLDARFLFHLLGSSRFQEFTSSDSSSATINNLNPTKIGRFVFSLPPLEVQRRIADVLDDFDALVNDLSSGLPAEITARRQQYEYYRDRLLTFPEKK